MGPIVPQGFSAFNASSSTRWLNSSQLNSRLMKSPGLKGVSLTISGKIADGGGARQPGSERYRAVTDYSQVGGKWRENQKTPKIDAVKTRVSREQRGEASA